MPTFMNVSLYALYRRHRMASLMVAAGLAMILSFLWFLPGAFHAKDMDEYHRWSWPEYKFSNVLDIYVLHNLDKPQGDNWVLSGIGVDYPALLSVMIRATSRFGVTDAVTTDIYRSSTPPLKAAPGNTNT